MEDHDSEKAVDNKRQERVKRKQLSKFTLSPSYNAAAVIAPYGEIYGEQDIDELALHLFEINEKESADNTLKRSEEMLLSQAHALQAIFTNLSRRAFLIEQIDYLERYLRLALKAQNQCTRALEVLAMLKNPTSVAIVKQANIGQAVQVNNGVPSPVTPSRARENENPTNELLEVKHEQRLDRRKAVTSKQADTHMEAVEQVNRTKNINRQG